MEKIIKKQASAFFNVNEEDIIIVERLLGGRSNLMYLFKLASDNTLYTFRIPGKNSEEFVDRNVELSNLNTVKPLSLNSDVLFFDIKTGYKISKFVQGECLTNLDITAHLKDVANLLHKLHDAPIKCVNDYAPFGRLAQYENLMCKLNYKEDRSEYLKIKNDFLKHKDFLEDDTLTVCHGDSQTDNIIISKNNDIYLLDWEFTGNNYAFYDIACFGDKDFNNALNLLEAYLGRKPQNDELKRLYLWRTFQCLQWHNVALYKHLIGLSEELKVDFKFFSDLYTQKALTYYTEAMKFNNN